MVGVRKGILLNDVLGFVGIDVLWYCGYFLKWCVGYCGQSGRGEPYLMMNRGRTPIHFDIFSPDTLSPEYSNTAYCILPAPPPKPFQVGEYKVERMQVASLSFFQPSLDNKFNSNMQKLFQDALIIFSQNNW